MGEATMTGLLRVTQSAVLAIALAGAGLSNVLVAQAATNTPPVITGIALGVIRAGVVVPTDVANEGDTVQVDVAFTDPDVADRHLVTIGWGDGFTTTATLTGGERSVFMTRTYPDEGLFITPEDTLQITVTIEDLVNSPVIGGVILTLHNVAPVVTAFTVMPATILDHQSATATGTFVDPSKGDTYTLALDWGDGSAKTLMTLRANVRQFTASHPYLVAGNFTVTVTVTDDDGGVGGATAPIVVTSLNTPPSGLVVGVGPAAEGGATALTATFVDPDGETHTASLDWGDGTAPQSLALPAGVTSFSLTHVYQDAGTYNATVMVADSAVSTPPVTVIVSVANVGPTVMAMNLSASSIVELDSVTVDATFADPGVFDTFRLTMTWGDGTSWSTDLAAGTRVASATHQYLLAGSFGITTTVLDRDNAAGSMTTMLDVRARDHAPTGLMLSANSPVEASPATLSGSFVDLDAVDAHIVSVAWGDGSTGSLPLGAGALSFSATHTYATRGTYHVNVAVTDPAGLAASAAVDVVVQAKKRGKQECEQLLALEQRSAWAIDHEGRGLFARAAAFLSGRVGCDDEEQGKDDDRSAAQNGSTTHAANPPTNEAAAKPKLKRERSTRAER
jgi:PKD repeat protein